MSEVLWQLESVCLHGDSTDRLRNLNLSIHRGVTSLVGFSGAGKTSLLNVLAQLESPDAGSVQGPHVSVSSGQLPLYWSPQEGGLWPHLTVRQHLYAVAPQEFSNLADKLLAEFDLAGRENAFPSQLSRGELSRLGVARCLAARPAIMLMDEPLAHTDPARRPVWWQAIREVLQVTGSSLVFSTHEPEAAVGESESVICLANGTAVYEGATSELYHRPPSAELGQFLGMLNWFDDEQAAVWLRGMPGSPEAIGLRPERLDLIPDDDGPFTVSSFRFWGSFAETTLDFTCDTTTHQRTILSRPSASLSPQQRVRLILK